MFTPMCIFLLRVLSNESKEVPFLAVLIPLVCCLISDLIALNLILEFCKR